MAPEHHPTTIPSPRPVKTVEAILLLPRATLDDVLAKQVSLCSDCSSCFSDPDCTCQMPDRRSNPRIPDRTPLEVDGVEKTCADCLEPIYVVFVGGHRGQEFCRHAINDMKLDSLAPDLHGADRIYYDLEPIIDRQGFVAGAIKHRRARDTWVRMIAAGLVYVDRDTGHIYDILGAGSPKAVEVWTLPDSWVAPEGWVAP